MTALAIGILKTVAKIWLSMLIIFAALAVLASFSHDPPAPPPPSYATENPRLEAGYRLAINIRGFACPQIVSAYPRDPNELGNRVEVFCGSGHMINPKWRYVIYLDKLIVRHCGELGLFTNAECE